jgi:hypothetical protein
MCAVRRAYQQPAYTCNHVASAERPDVFFVKHPSTSDIGTTCTLLLCTRSDIFSDCRTRLIERAKCTRTTCCVGVTPPQNVSTLRLATWQQSVSSTRLVRAAVRATRAAVRAVGHHPQNCCQRKWGRRRRGLAVFFNKHHAQTSSWRKRAADVLQHAPF